MMMTVTSKVKAQVNLQDSLALVDLYNNTNGRNWSDTTNWLTKAPVSSWDNITLDTISRRIIEINLSEKNLVGNIPSSIGNLTQLQVLNLSNNSISGCIPDSIANLTQLQTLYISNNSITGSIPSYIGNLINLTSLDLSKNQLTGKIPSSIGNLTSAINISNLKNLETIDVSNNELNSFNYSAFQSLSNFPFILGNNNFTFNGLEQLLTYQPNIIPYTYTPQNHISVSKNGNTLSVSVGGTPRFNNYNWYNDSVLIIANVGDSTLKIPYSGNYSVIVTNSFVNQLTLYSDTISVYYPINNQDSLALIDLYDSTNGANWSNNTNWLSSKPISTWYGVVTDTSGRVKELKLGINNLNGTIPNSIGKLKKLTYLDFSVCNLYGVIPDSIGNLTNLQHLLSYHTSLNGSIPSSIGNLYSLKELTLTGCKLVGNIPSSIGNLSQLKSLNLARNGFTSVPESIGNLAQLTDLDLSYNSLTGNIPVSIGNLTQLMDLDLSYNSIAGSIPSSIGNLTSLNYLDISNNEITGSIPSSIGNLINLTNLDFSINQLSDSLPSSIGNIKNLQTLFLDSNKISGNIPTTLVNLDTLQKLDLHSNQLSGRIPNGIGGKNVTIIDLSKNHLNGELPDSFANSNGLNFLDLSYNKLSGSIHPSIGSLYALFNLNLSHNQLSGKIPDTLENLYFLGSLFLNNNSLSDTIPESLGNLLWLNDLDLSNNKLSGGLPVSFGLHWMVVFFLPPNNDTVIERLLRNVPESCYECPSSNYNILKLDNNKFIFSAAEEAIKLHVNQLSYAPQSTVHLNKSGNELSVSVGGTSSIDTFRWYKDTMLVATKVGDSSYTISNKGNYWVVATNGIAKQLTLYSDTLNITSLPIKSINLQAKANNSVVMLQWQTIDEINTASFLIENSTDGKSFTTIDTKTAAGSGNNSYFIEDATASDGINYYRIRSVDKVGNVNYSQVVSIELSKINVQCSIYPNPVQNVLTITGKHVVLIELIDNLGKLIRTVSLQDATNPTLSVGGMNKGIYHLRVQTTNAQVSELNFIKE